MRPDIFNACLLAGWFMLTLGAIVLNPGAGIAVGGLAMIVLTLFIAMRVGIQPPKEGKPATDKAA